MMDLDVKKRRDIIVRSVFEDDHFPENLIRNPDRISTALGFCETGESITRLITTLLEAFKGREAMLNDTLKIIHEALVAYKKKQ